MNQNEKLTEHQVLLFALAVHVIAINAACAYIGERDRSAMPVEYYKLFTTQANHIVATMPNEELKELMNQIYSDLLPSTSA